MEKRLSKRNSSLLKEGSATREGSTNESSAKDVHAKDASTKNVNAKDTRPKEDNSKDARAKEANAKNASAKGTKANKQSESILKEPAETDTAKNKQPSPDNKDKARGGGFSYDEFPPSPRRGQPPILPPVRVRRVYYHDENDLADTLDDNPNKPKRTVADDLYSPWDEAVKSMRYASVISGLSMAIALVADVAVNGTDKLTVDRVWLPVQFLRTVMNDKGETPPNILKFLEHIDVKTKDTGNPHFREEYSII